MDTKHQYWEQSYQRNENCILFPKEECVKFLSRFVRAKAPDGSFVEKLASHPLKGLDFGCGMGRQTQLLHEFGIEGVGVDISTVAIDKARQLYADIADAFVAIEPGGSLPFSDQTFDIAMAESVLDSMSFELARHALQELSRVVKSRLFISVISHRCNHDGDYQAVDEVVTTLHEQGTIQSYYDDARIQALIAGTGFSVEWHNLHMEYINSPEVTVGRHYLVLNKSGA
ncbi:class I SAM-dependent methyltransferase [Aestuariibacter halophilus]|uniref:Class I SAM-dependent methyltransferase n=1 Tax=Fluctibacter halophilus TaxID=226011 RepID=A0ABS8G3V6_9ALTE|nr:class I SAM-dependent methyltransferase [Aestuariibacter halophilus]MCC2615123.1 class I SAM-dependent methyltransferase [Aestuariibacter halophilus]